MSRERLDVEDDSARAERLGNLFSSITESTPSTESAPSFPSKPQAMPESDVLARARAFLPLLAADNASLLSQAAQDPDSVIVEGRGNVRMDVGLGVFDVKGDVPRGMEVVERDEDVWAGAEDEEEEEEEEEGEDEEEEDGEEDESDSDDDEHDEDDNDGIQEGKSGTEPRKLVTEL